MECDILCVFCSVSVSVKCSVVFLTSDTFATPSPSPRPSPSHSPSLFPFLAAISLFKVYFSCQEYVEVCILVGGSHRGGEESTASPKQKNSDPYWIRLVSRDKYCSAS